MFQGVSDARWSHHLANRHEPLKDGGQGGLIVDSDVVTVEAGSLLYSGMKSHEGHDIRALSENEIALKDLGVIGTLQLHDHRRLLEVPGQRNDDATSAVILLVDAGAGIELFFLKHEGAMELLGVFRAGVGIGWDVVNGHGGDVFPEAFDLIGGHLGAFKVVREESNMDILMPDCDMREAPPPRRHPLHSAFQAKVDPDRPSWLDLFGTHPAVQLAEKYQEYLRRQALDGTVNIDRVPFRTLLQIVNRAPHVLIIFGFTRWTEFFAATTDSYIRYVMIAHDIPEAREWLPGWYRGPWSFLVDGDFVGIRGAMAKRVLGAILSEDITRRAWLHWACRSRYLVQPWELDVLDNAIECGTPPRPPASSIDPPRQQPSGGDPHEPPKTAAEGGTPPRPPASAIDSVSRGDMEVCIHQDTKDDILVDPQTAVIWRSIPLVSKFNVTDLTTILERESVFKPVRSEREQRFQVYIFAQQRAVKSLWD